MELGKRLKEARLAAGMSQRQLCGDEITRNMLSQIENGAARPSMDTLRYLASRLGKPVSFFLDEETVSSPNQGAITAARNAWRAGDWRGTLNALENWQAGDELFEEEMGLLWFCALMDGAAEALEEGKRPFARGLLEQAGEIRSIYRSQALERRHGLLTLRAGGQARLPSLDEELMLRAELAEDPIRAAALLDAAEDRGDPRWNYLRGRVHVDAGEYEAGARCLTRAEEVFPAETAPLLELCYRELEDYKMAYFYACRQR